jgi:hypothetical protein
MPAPEGGLWDTVPGRARSVAQVCSARRRFVMEDSLFRGCPIWLTFSDNGIRT